MRICRGSSVVEQLVVDQLVVGSIPTLGTIIQKHYSLSYVRNYARKKDKDLSGETNSKI